MSDEVSQLRERINLLLKAVGEAAFCRGCNMPIYWLTHRNGKRAPYNVDGLTHWASCPNADRFRKDKNGADSTAAR